jgi:hypothetical protein
VSVWCGLDPLKGVQGRESIAIDSRPSTATVIGTFLVSVWRGLDPLKGVQGRESIAIDSRPWTPGNGFKPHHTDTRNVPMTVTTV